MIATNYSELRADLKNILDEVEENNETVIIKRNGGKGSVIVSLAEYNSMLETMHLLSTVKNVDHLRASMEQLEQNKVVIKSVTSLL